VGATTANTGAFTTLSASGSITGTGNSLLNFGGGDVYWQFQSANNYVGRKSDGDVWLNVAAGYSVKLGYAGSAIATASSTGLAVTGALSSTGTVTTGSGSGETLLAGSLNLGKDIGITDGSGIVTGNARVVTFKTSGNVGIGTASPAAKLHISGTNAGIIFDRVSADVDPSGIQGSIYVKENGISNYEAMLFRATGYRWQSDTGTDRMLIDSSGNLLVGTTSASPSSGVGIKLAYDPTAPYVAVTGTGTYFYAFNDSASAYRFYVTPAGQINATSTSINAISDVSLKENIRDLETGLAEILALKPRRFDWKAETHINEKNVAGFIAQEVEGILPELVYDFEYNKDSTKKSLKMGDMLPTVIKALQELNANLVAQVAALSQRLAALESN
jgi:hypothetical protein